MGWLKLEDSRLAMMGSTAATYAFSAFAIGELIADKLPFIPNRTSPGPLFGRIVLGALCGATFRAASGDPVTLGAILGGVGGVVGAFAGYQARKRLVEKLGCPDWVIAVLEDVVAVGGGLFLVSRF
jgi:uncharacterized membrane protein